MEVWPLDAFASLLNVDWEIPARTLRNVTDMEMLMFHFGD